MLYYKVNNIKRVDAKCWQLNVEVALKTTHVVLTRPTGCNIIFLAENNFSSYAVVAELADALDSGSSGGNFVEVQVLSTAP